MKSNKIILSEQITVFGNILTEHSKIDSNLINESILKDLEKTTFGVHNKYYDINLTYHGQHSWIFDLIKEQVSVYHGIPFINYKNWANIEGYNEISITRNNVDSNNIEGQPHFTLIYMLKAGSNAGELVINYDTPLQKNKNEYFSVQEGNFYLFNSNINYYFSKNFDQENRTYITWTCHKR